MDGDAMHGDDDAYDRHSFDEKFRQFVADNDDSSDVPRWHDLEYQQEATESSSEMAPPESPNTPKGTGACLGFSVNDAVSSPSRRSESGSSSPKTPKGNGGTAMCLGFVNVVLNVFGAGSSSSTGTSTGGGGGKNKKKKSNRDYQPLATDSTPIRQPSKSLSNESSEDSNETLTWRSTSPSNET